MGSLGEWLTPPATLGGQALLAYVLIDLFIIVVLARLCGNVAMRVKQPRVVGEIIAGLLLGPTLLGETLSQVVAPMQVRPVLAALATLGLVLFMFLAGLEFDARAIHGRMKQAGTLAFLSVALPAAVAFPLAWVLHDPLYTSAGLLPFALTLGASLTVTAFPVMAHILMERGELNAPLGALAVAAAGIISILMFAYIALAGAIAAGGGFDGLLMKLLLLVVFALFSWWVARPFLARRLAYALDDGKLRGDDLALVFAGMVLFAFVTHVAGIHALVGGFVWGSILPPARGLRAALAARVRDIALVFLLPIFFAQAGFQADLKLLTLETVPAVLLTLAAATGAKFAAALPGRVYGLTWREIGRLGALFNTRGLLVLVAGLIGVELGVFSPLSFTIIVLVALVSNIMTLPLLALFSPPTVVRGVPAARTVGQMRVDGD